MIIPDLVKLKSQAVAGPRSHASEGANEGSPVICVGPRVSCPEVVAPAELSARAAFTWQKPVMASSSPAIRSRCSSFRASATSSACCR